MKIQLIRHATLLLEIAGQRILVDPMLSKAGMMSAVPDVANPGNNPLVDLPFEPTSLLNIDSIMLTHTHRDHFDDAAVQMLAHDTRVFCQPADQHKISSAGFSQVQPIEDTVEWQGIHISRTAGQHGSGTIGQQMGPVSGFVLESPDEPLLYIAGDTIWCPEVQSALEIFQPQIIICFAGAARFSSGDSITMDTEDIYKVCKQVPTAQVIIAHLEAWNHCSLSRQDLKNFIQVESLAEQVLIPDDGEWMDF